MFIVQEEDAGAPLGPFYPKPAPLELNRVEPPPDTLPDWREQKTLIASLAEDHRIRHDFDNRSELFRKGGPDEVEPGSILLIEQIASRSRPRKQVFAGVVIAIRRKGIATNIVLRNYVLGTGVEMEFYIYSPMVTRIKVLKRITGIAQGGDDIYWLKDRPHASPLAFSKIDEMVIRDREAEKRKAVGAASTR